jgi:hypothetical protein
VLARRIRVDLATDVIERVGDVLRVARRRPLEQQVLEEVRRAGELG